MHLPRPCPRKSGYKQSTLPNELTFKDKDTDWLTDQISWKKKRMCRAHSSLQLRPNVIGKRSKQRLEILKDANVTQDVYTQPKHFWTGKTQGMLLLRAPEENTQMWSSAVQDRKPKPKVWHSRAPAMAEQVSRPGSMQNSHLSHPGGPFQWPLLYTRKWFSVNNHVLSNHYFLLDCLILK